jgi:hypothetical protein
VFALFPWPWFLLYVFFALVGFTLVFLRDYNGFVGKKWWLHGMNFAIAFMLMFGGMNLFARNRSILNPHVGLAGGDIIAKFGITPVFVRDAFRIYQQKSSGLFAAALAQEKERSFQLDGEYYPNESPKNIVAIQVESLDNGLLHAEAHGKAITPFLNSLLEHSLYYRTQASTGYGSATADFVLLNGTPPAMGMFNYNIADLPYNNSLPAFLRDHGYQTFSVHGVRSTFYNRKEAFSAMQFDHAAFSAEIIRELQNKDSTFRARFSAEEIARNQDQSWLLDELVFEYGRWVLEENADKNNFLLLITVTSHTPFNAPVPDAIVPQAVEMEDRFLNTVHYMDSELRKFYESLPDGTLVVIYGDHAPYIETKDYQTDVVGNTHYIPVILAVKGKNIAAQQTVHTGTSAVDLSLRDVHSYIRKTIEANQMQPREISPTGLQPNIMTASGETEPIR